MIFQVACGLAYLEKKRIAHNDIKLENILCFENNKIFKISDFGFAQKFHEENEENKEGEEDNRFISQYHKWVNRAK